MIWLTLFAIKSTLVLLAAWAACALLRRQSAALRHFVWTVGFAAVVLCGTGIPARVALPAPQPALVGAVQVERVAHVAAASQPAQAGTPVPLGLWALGGGLVALWFLAGAVRTAYLVRRGVPVEYPGVEGVRVIESGDVPVPLAWGILRPVIVLPEAARRWPASRLEAVLLHERMHIRRRDLPAQVVAQAACALAWFNPLAWMALGRLRKERECACDDAVLASGVPAHDYATHLVDLARALSARRRLADAPAMAEARGLEARVRALLDGGRDRRPLNRRAAAAVASMALAVLLPIAAVTARAQTAGGSLAGIVTDPSGGRIPGCRVIATNLDGNNEEIAKADAAGEYQFTSIPPGHYALQFQARGFAVTKTEAAVTAGAAARADGQLSLGQISEAMTVHGEKPPMAALPRSATPQRIRVGGNVIPARMIVQTKPRYPDELKQLGIEGNVVIRAVISKEGAVLNPKVISTVDSGLAQAALDAVTQWRYEPSRLNGQPVETVTTITIGFDLSGEGVKTPR